MVNPEPIELFTRMYLRQESGITPYSMHIGIYTNELLEVADEEMTS